MDQNSSFESNVATPIFDEYSPNMATPPSLPFKCRVASQTKHGLTYTVNVDEFDNWSCTCPDFRHERDVPGRPRYFCKHCITVGHITGLKRPKRWRRQSGGKDWLIGEILTLENGNTRMQVDGFVTKSELYDVYDMTKRLIEKFLPAPDEGAVFWSFDDDEVGGCDLYDENRVKTLLKSTEYLVEKEKTDRARERSRKGNAKRKATLARKRALEEQARAEARNAFGGSIYVARYTYTYGWREYGVYARNEDHAKTLMNRVVSIRRWARRIHRTV